MKKEEKKRNVRYSEGLVDDLCNFSRSDSRKRRGLWPGNKFPSFNLNQHVPQRNELRVQPDRRRQAVWAVPRARSTARQSGLLAVPESCSFCRYRYSRLSPRDRNLWVFHEPAWLWLVGKRSRDYLPGRATLSAHRTRHGARPGPTLCAVVYPRPPCVPRRREREKRSSAEGEIFCIPEKRSILCLPGSNI